MEWRRNKSPATEYRYKIGGSHEKQRYSVRRKIVVVSLTVVLFITAPFILFQRFGLFAQVSLELSVWPALILSLFVTVGSTALAAALLLRNRLNIHRVFKIVAMVLLALSLIGSLYGLLYIAPAHTKTDREQATYISLHPFLRLSISTALLFDDGLLITSTDRTMEDYKRWNLPPNTASAHFKQPDGFIHAVDLRTKNRSGWQNLALSLYYRVLGYKVIRHRGTADHLHIEMPVN